MIELGLTKELLELGGPNLVPFLQSASKYETTQVQHSLQVLFYIHFCLIFSTECQLNCDLYMQLSKLQDTELGCG